LILDATPAPPPVVAPTIRSTLDVGNGTMSVRYPTTPGLRYRVHGGSNLTSLAPVGNWSDGTGIEQEFVATSALTGGASSYFLRVEMAAK
jgi:hypothetical protein